QEDRARNGHCRHAPPRYSRASDLSGSCLSDSCLSDSCKDRRHRVPNVAPMQQRLNVLTLGVDDVGRARSFYEALGWKIGFTDGDIVMFQAGPMIISLWDRAKLAE